MKRLGIVVLLLAGFVVSASAQFGLMANKLEEMLKPALSGSFNYKAIGVNVVATTLACFTCSTTSEYLFKRNCLRNSIIDCNHFATFAFK